MTDSPRFVESVREIGVGLRLLEELFREAPFGVYVDHPEKGCVYANPALLDHFGVSWEDFRGFQWARFVCKEDAERIREEIHRYETSLEPIRITYRVRPPGGDERWVHARARALRDEQGRHIGSIAIVEDVTDERVLRDQIAGRQKLEAVGRLAARIAHDFNNLLTVMLASSDVLSDSVRDSEGTESLSTLENAIEQAAQITRQLLALTRHRMGKSAISALDRELHELEPLLGRTLGEGIDLRLDLGAPDALVGLDTGQLGQIVINLATNGHDAMRGYGRLDVRTRVREDVVRLEIQDHGEGMTQETVARIFEPFFTTKGEGRGTGLGLTTVRDLASVVGGRVEVSTTPGEGTCFTVVLPTVHDEYAPQPTKVGDAPVERHEEHVLLVEDKDDLRQSIAYAMALHGYHVRSARSLAEARSQLESPPDLLVTDVMLTDGNGTDLVRELRIERPDLPVVVISGFAGEATIGVDGRPERTYYLPKPFRPRDLLAAMHELLAGSRAG